MHPLELERMVEVPVLPRGRRVAHLAGGRETGLRVVRVRWSRCSRRGGSPRTPMAAPGTRRRCGSCCTPAGGGHRPAATPCADRSPGASPGRSAGGSCRRSWGSPPPGGSGWLRRCSHPGGSPHTRSACPGSRPRGSPDSQASRARRRAGTGGRTGLRPTRSACGRAHRWSGSRPGRGSDPWSRCNRRGGSSRTPTAAPGRRCRCGTNCTGPRRAIPRAGTPCVGRSPGASLDRSAGGSCRRWSGSPPPHGSGSARRCSRPGGSPRSRSGCPGRRRRRGTRRSRASHALRRAGTGGRTGLRPTRSACGRAHRWSGSRPPRGSGSARRCSHPGGSPRSLSACPGRHRRRGMRRSRASHARPRAGTDGRNHPGPSSDRWGCGTPCSRSGTRPRHDSGPRCSRSRRSGSCSSPPGPHRRSAGPDGSRRSPPCGGER